jgi:hypothetical protein
MLFVVMWWCGLLSEVLSKRDVIPDQVEGEYIRMYVGIGMLFV